MPSTTRRRVLATVAAGIGLAGCLSGDSRPGDVGPVEGEWPVYGGDPGHGRVADGGPADPDRVWTAGPDGARSVGTPSVADGRVYAPADSVSDRARNDYRLHALSASTGEERWRVPLRAAPNPSPATNGDRTVVSAQRSTERGRVVAVREPYGDEEWLYDVDARVTAPPTVDGTTVYVPDWRGRVHALSLLDGSVRWSREVDADGEGRTFAGPAAVHDDAVYLGSTSGRTGVVAVDAETGDERWSRSTDVVTAGPVVDDSLVVVRAYGYVAAFDPDGSRRWTFGVPGDGWGAVALDDRRVYVPAPDALYAIDRGGDLAWRYDPGARVGPPTVAGDDVLVRVDGEVRALSRSNGERRWSADGDANGGVVATPDALFVARSGGRVSALGDG